MGWFKVGNHSTRDAQGTGHWGQRATKRFHSSFLWEGRTVWRTKNQTLMHLILCSNLCTQQQQRPSTGRSERDHCLPIFAECPRCRSTILDELHPRNDATPRPEHLCHHYCWSVGREETRDRGTISDWWCLHGFVCFKFSYKLPSLSSKAHNLICYSYVAFIYIFWDIL